MARRLLRFCRHLLLALLLLTALAGAAAWLWRLPLAGWAARTLAEAHGAPLQLTVTALDFDGAAVRDVRLGGTAPITAAAVRARYDWRRLPDGQVDRIEIDGLVARATLDDDGLRVPALEGLGGGTGGGAPPAMPPIRLADARIELDTPQGMVDVRGDAEIRPAAAGIEAVGDIAATLGENRLAGRITVRRGDDGRIEGELRLTGGTFARAGVAATLAESRLAGAWDPAGDALPTLDGRIALPRLTLHDASLGATTLAVHSDGRAARAELQTATADGGMRLAASLDLQDAATAPTAALRATFDFESLAPLSDLAARGRIDVDGFAALPTLTALPSLAEVPVDARVRIDIAGLSLPQGLDGGMVTATVHLRTTPDGALSVALAEPATVAGNAPAPVRATLQPTDAPLALIAFTPRRAAGRLRAEATLPPGAVALTAEYAVRQEDGTWLLAFPSLAASAATLALDPATLSDVTLTATDATVRIADAVTAAAPGASLRVGRWAAAGIVGDASVEATALAWTPEGFAGRGRVEAGATGAGLENARLHADIMAAGTAGRFDVALTDCARLTLRRIRTDAATITGGPLRLCQTDRPALRRAETTDLALRLQPSKWQVAAATPLSLDLSALDLAASLGGDGWTARLRGRNSGLEAPDLQIGLEEIDLDASLHGPRRGDATLAIGWLRDRRAAPRFMPMKLAAKAGLRGDRIDIDGTLRDRGEQATVTIRAQHDLAQGTGEARLATDPPITFAPDGAQPQRLVPLLRGVVTSVEGILAAEATAAWGDGPLRSAARVELTSVGAQAPMAVLAGLSGTLNFVDLNPPATAPRQKLRLATLDVGLPLSDGEAEITLRPDGRLAIHRLGWPWAGGRIHVEDEVVDPRAERIALTLRVDDVGLAELAALLENESLVATGRVAGTIPVEIAGDTVFIRQARLASTGSGTLRYASEGAEAVLDTGGGGSELLADALRDFRYDQLVLTLDGETTGNLDLGMQLRGFSPEVYSGSPVELNVSVGGALFDMLQQGLAGYRIPDNIVRQLRGDEDDDPQDLAPGAGGDAGPARGLRANGEARSP